MAGMSVADPRVERSMSAGGDVSEAAHPGDIPVSELGWVLPIADGELRPPGPSAPGNGVHLAKMPWRPLASGANIMAGTFSSDSSETAQKRAAEAERAAEMARSLGKPLLGVAAPSTPFALPWQAGPADGLLEP